MVELAADVINVRLDSGCIACIVEVFDNREDPIASAQGQRHEREHRKERVSG